MLLGFPYFWRRPIETHFDSLVSHAQRKFQRMPHVMFAHPGTKKPRRMTWEENLATRPALRREHGIGQPTCKMSNIFQVSEKIKAKQAKHVCKTSQVSLVHDWRIVSAISIYDAIMHRLWVPMALSFVTFAIVSVWSLDFNWYGLDMLQLLRSDILLCYVTYFIFRYMLHM